jgi:soluble lytic murein transglycosylase-like protein
MPTIPFHLALSLALALAVAPPPARADCIADAAARHHVNADVLRAIGWQESRLQPQALGHNANGSIDVGAFQINSIHLPELARYGIDRQALRDGCVCADVAAWHYRRQIDLQGDTWLAVGAYHSRTADRAAWYANRIAALLMHWNVMPASPLPFPAWRTRAPESPRSPVPPAASPGRAPVDVAGYGAIAFLPSAR